jgi:predicted enzyme related to lactoylglutathione lyase
MRGPLRSRCSQRATRSESVLDGAVRFGFEVKNLEEVVAELWLAGVVVVTEPHRPQFGGWLAATADPDGYPIQLYEPG